MLTIFVIKLDLMKSIWFIRRKALIENKVFFVAKYKQLLFCLSLYTYSSSE